jgi:hypothetical protein
VFGGGGRDQWNERLFTLVSKAPPINREIIPFSFRKDRIEAIAIGGHGQRRFSVIIVTLDQITLIVFRWRPPQPVKEIDVMKPAIVYECHVKQRHQSPPQSVSPFGP